MYIYIFSQEKNQTIFTFRHYVLLIKSINISISIINQYNQSINICILNSFFLYKKLNTQTLKFLKILEA